MEFDGIQANDPNDGEFDFANLLTDDIDRIEVIRGALNRQILGGITSFNVYYRFDGLTAEETRALNAYVGRCVSQLTEGQRSAHVALLYPIETLWTRWVAEPTSIHSWYAIEGGAPAARRVEMALPSRNAQPIQPKPA